MLQQLPAGRFALSEHRKGQLVGERGVGLREGPVAREQDECASAAGLHHITDAAVKLFCEFRSARLAHAPGKVQQCLLLIVEWTRIDAVLTGVQAQAPREVVQLARHGERGRGEQQRRVPRGQPRTEQRPDVQRAAPPGKTTASAVIPVKKVSARFIDNRPYESSKCLQTCSVRDVVQGQFSALYDAA